MKYCPYILLTIWLFSDIYLLEASYPHQSTPSTDLSKNQFNEINTKVGELEEVFGHFIETVKSVKESKPENVDELKKKINGHKNKFLELMNIMMSYLDQPTPSTDLSENQINAIIRQAVELKKGFEHLKNSYTSVFEKLNEESILVSIEKNKDGQWISVIKKFKTENVDELMNGPNENKKTVQNLMDSIMDIIKTTVPTGNSNPGDYNNVGSNTNSQYNRGQNILSTPRGINPDPYSSYPEPNPLSTSRGFNPEQYSSDRVPETRPRGLTGRPSYSVQSNSPSFGSQNPVGVKRPAVSRGTSNLDQPNPPPFGAPNNVGVNLPAVSRGTSNLGHSNPSPFGPPNKLSTSRGFNPEQYSSDRVPETPLPRVSTKSASNSDQSNPPPFGAPNNVGDSRPEVSRGTSNLDQSNPPSFGAPNKMKDMTCHDGYCVYTGQGSNDMDNGRPNNQLQPPPNTYSATYEDDPKIKEISKLLSNDSISNKDELFIIYFSINNCKPCTVFLPKVKNLLKGRNITMLHVNDEGTFKTAEAFNINLFPSLVFIKEQKHLKTISTTDLNLFNRTLNLYT